MRILITNHGLAARAGTELYVRDLALGLAKRGHDVVCFAPVLGQIADEIAASGITTVDDLNGIIEPPDIIHAHHHTSAVLAYTAYPDVPALQFCHGVLPWQEAPLAKFANIRRYVAVDHACRDFLIEGHAIAPDTISVVLNGVDLARFTESRSPAGNETRRSRALLLSNIADPASISPFQRACHRAGMTLDIAGSRFNKVMDCPEAELANYGIVFAKARAALEAMASGCAVFLADYGKAGGLVTQDRFDDLRPYNFGLRTLTEPPQTDTIEAELSAIDWHDAAQVTRRVRSEASFDALLDELLALYQGALTAPSLHDVPHETAMSDYLHTILPMLTERDELAGRLYSTVNSGLGRDREMAATIVSLLRDGGAQTRRKLAQEAVALDPDNGEARDLLDRLKFN